MAGRKPKPTAVKKLEGNPGKRKLNSKEPVPAKGMPTCPDWLMPEAKKEWERPAELMNQMGVLTEVDTAAFVEICKKVGKSELAAAIALYLLYADNEPSAEVYGAAADRQQASVQQHGFRMQFS